MAEDIADDLKATTAAEMLAILRDEKGRDGFQEELDDTHTASFLARGARLIVSFETIETTLGQPNGLPVGLDFVEDKSWSLLHLSATRSSWFRSDAVFAFFDRLVDDCFFEDFDQVLFYGSGIGGYAACAYSVAAPGARVLAISPQATLDTERAGWDTRFPAARRMQFDTRYGFAPDMIEGADRAFILHDPYRRLDQMHASLFQGPAVTHLPCRHLDGMIELALRELDILHQVIEGAANGSLTHAGFFQLLRARREHARYLRTLLFALDKQGQKLRAARLCLHVLRDRRGPVFRKRLDALVRELKAEGDLPAWLAETDEAQRI